MTEPVLIAIISAVIAGVFGLIGKQMELARPSRLNNPLANETVGPTRPNSVNFGTVVKHVGVLQLCANLVAFLTSVILVVAGANETSIIVIVLILGTIVSAVGFLISGSLVNHSVRWTHLIFVAIGTLIFSLALNSLLLQQPLSSEGLILGAVQVFGTMALAGVLLNALKRS